MFIVDAVLCYSRFITVTLRMPASTPRMSFLVSVIIIVHLTSDQCSGSRRHLLLDIEDTDSVNVDRGHEDYMDGGTMSGEDNGNAGGGGGGRTMNGGSGGGGRFRCAKCIVG